MPSDKAISVWVDVGEAVGGAVDGTPLMCLHGYAPNGDEASVLLSVDSALAAIAALAHGVVLSSDDDSGEKNLANEVCAVVARASMEIYRVDVQKEDDHGSDSK